jgi:hypothetical protein
MSRTAPTQSTEAPEPPAQDKLVAHFKDGIVTRGYSRDFSPGQEVFHILADEEGITSSRRIHREQLKALFQVKTWGTPGGHADRRKEFPNEPSQWPAPRTIVEFYDGEEIWGYSQDYRSEDPAFFLLPADPEDNNSRIYVVRSSLVKIQFLDH